MLIVGVAMHLGIDLEEYDTRIRTFIPSYEEMLDTAAAAVPAWARTIVDLGVGTGALAARCLKHAPHAHVVGIDADPDILTLAARRLRTHATIVCGSFLRVPLPPCDAVVASFALHHVRTRSAKARLYRRVHAALRPRGRFISVDCHPAATRAFARAQWQAWRFHLLGSYPRWRAAALLRAWSREDVYVPLESEMTLLQRSEFLVEVLWRRGAFAVISASRRG